MKSKFLIAAAAATISAPTGLALAADAPAGDSTAPAPAPASAPTPAPAPAVAPAPHSARWQHLHNHLLGDNVHLTRRLHGERAAHRALREHDAWTNHRLGRANRRLRRQLDAHAAAARHPAMPAEMQRIAQCESGGNPHAVGGGGRYRGKYQFDERTWRANGGKGDPAAASEGEQDRVAMRLYKKRGTAPWPTCGR